MRVPAVRDGAALRAVAGMMSAVVTDEGSRAPTAIEDECLEAIGRHVLNAPIDLASCDPRPVPALAHAIDDPELRLFALRLCMVLSMVGEGLRREQVDRLAALAGLLQVPADDELAMLRLALAGRHKRLLFKVTRRAASDFWAKGGKPRLRDWLEVAEQGFFSGRILRPRVAARYRALAGLPAGTLGRELHDFYAGHGFPFPGEKGGVPEHFTLHECTHVLSGYDTDPVGEMLVTAFTAGAKKRHVMDWVFVSLLQWHLGANVGSFTVDCSHRGLLQPDAFFHAWARGMGMRLSLMDDPWSWWEVIERPVEELRANYGIAPLAVAQRIH